MQRRKILLFYGFNDFIYSAISFSVESLAVSNLLIMFSRSFSVLFWLNLAFACRSSTTTISKATIRLHHVLFILIRKAIPLL